MRTEKLLRLGKLRVHSILYGNEPSRISQALEHLERSADLAIHEGVFQQVSVVFGDCSPDSSLKCVIDNYVGRGQALHEISYRHFDENLGSAHGHNRLLEGVDADYVLIMNPDIMVAPTTLIELSRPLNDPRVGVVEAKQLPIEHPKEYSLTTGETPWASTACAMVPANVFSIVGNFDHKTFFLYCDDVDFSWRVKLAGFKIIYQSSALAYHDKRLGSNGNWVASSAEKYYSAEAALLLAYKYSRDDIVDEIMNYFVSSGEPHLVAAVAEFEKRKMADNLPEQIDEAHQAATFKNGSYAAHRFGL